jgi:hypothetical protein
MAQKDKGLRGRDRRRVDRASVWLADKSGKGPCKNWIRPAVCPAESGLCWINLGNCPVCLARNDASEQVVQVQKTK